MEKIGEYVSPETTMTLILPALSSGGGGLSTFRLGCLRALQGILRGTSPAALEAYLPRLLECLSDRELLQNENIGVMVEVSKCLLYVGQKLPQNSSVLFQYFMILVQLESFPGHDKVAGWSELQQSVQLAFEEHAKYVKISVLDLYVGHLDQALELLTQTHATWNQYSPEPRVLQSLLYKSGNRFISKLYVIIPIMATCVSSDKDYGLRERLNI